MGIFKNKESAPAADEDIGVDEAGAISVNDKQDKRQRMLLWGLGGAVVLAGGMYILDTGESAQAPAQTADQTQISTDAILNRERMDREWVAGYEHEMGAQAEKIEAVESNVERLRAMEDELASLRDENRAMAADGTRVFEAFERENQQLRQQLEQSRNRAPARGTSESAAALGLTPPPGSGAAADERQIMPPSRRGINLVSFSDSGGTARRIPESESAATYTDSPNYLPPNSMANAVVVVGADATTNTRSQSEPLPVVLRITGPARSVYGEGRLLATRVQGCLVNGAAYGDLSSEKVYVRLQRMTCSQPGGRFAVSSVKGFVAFGGKVGVRGRVVSREGSLTTQAFLAGLLGGAGDAFNAANRIPVIGQGNDPQLPSAENVGITAIAGGARQAGTTLSEYLIERAEQYQPVIEMPTGAQVEVVFLDGTFVRN